MGREVFSLLFKGGIKNFGHLTLPHTVPPPDPPFIKQIIKKRENSNKEEPAKQTADYDLIQDGGCGADGPAVFGDEFLSP